MPISGPNSWGSLTWLRNAAARALGIETYALCDTLNQNAIDDAAAGTMDRMALEGRHQWLRGEDGLVTSAGYSTGTVTVTQSSATVTGASTVWTTGTNVLARDAFNRGQGGFLRVLTVDSATSLTLTSPYPDATASTVTYTTYRDQYALPTDFLRLVSVREIDAAYELPIVTRGEWVRRWHGDYTTGRPRECFLAEATDSLTSTGQYLQLHPMPDAVYGYQVLYDKAPTWQSSGSGAVPGAPLAMQVLTNGMLAALFVSDPVRGPAYEAAYQRLAGALQKAQDRTQRQRIFLRGQFGVYGTPTWPSNYADTITTDNG